MKPNAGLSIKLANLWTDQPEKERGKKHITGIRNESGNISRDSTEIKRETKLTLWTLCSKIIDNLDKNGHIS